MADVAHKSQQLACGLNGHLQTLKTLGRIVGVVVGKLVADLPQGIPRLSIRKPAQLLQAGEAIQGRHDRHVFPQGFEDGRHESGTHVVLQAGIAVSKLVEQAAVCGSQVLIFCWRECTLGHVFQGVLQGFYMPQAQSMNLMQGQLFRCLAAGIFI